MHDSSFAWGAQETRRARAMTQEVLMRASVHVADVGMRSALALTRNQPSPQLLLARPSAVAEMDIDAGDFVVSGSKSISIEVKE